MSDNRRRKVGAYVTLEQKEKLKTFIMERPHLRCGKYTSTFTAKDAAKEWAEIAVQLNAIPGANKEWKPWRKTWQDIYSKIKQKQANVNKSRRQTGGGPPPAPMTDFEDSVAAIMNPRVISGHSEAAESTVNFTHGKRNLINFNDNEETQSQILPAKRKCSSSHAEFSADMFNTQYSQDWEDNELYSQNNASRVDNHKEININVATKTNNDEIAKESNVHAIAVGTQSEFMETANNLREANTEFGQFVARELSNVPIIKRRQIMWQIIRIFEHGSV